jgi:hypothetical protein
LHDIADLILIGAARGLGGAWCATHGVLDGMNGQPRGCPDNDRHHDRYDANGPRIQRAYPTLFALDHA